MAHMHYKGTGKVHSFRGQVIDGGQEKIRIQGAVGAIAWRINNFKVLGQDGNSNYENVTKIFREEQGTVDGTIDFRNDELLAAVIYQQHSVGQTYPLDAIVVFDNALFVRNIYVTCKNAEGSGPINYYVELEEVKLSKAGMAQLAVAAARRT